MIRFLVVLLLLAGSAQAQHTHTPRPPEKPGGITKDVQRFAYFAKEGEVMTFYVPTTVRYEQRVTGWNYTEKVFQPGTATCNAATFQASVNSYRE
jgi:hypothetical protein